MLVFDADGFVYFSHRKDVTCSYLSSFTIDSHRIFIIGVIQFSVLILDNQITIVIGITFSKDSLSRRDYSLEVRKFVVVLAIGLVLTFMQLCL